MRIAIVNDLPLAVEALRRVVALRQRYHIAWVARDGAEAVAQCARDKPDLILMDLIMPVMNGVEATRRIMVGSPCAILIVTASVNENAAMVFEAMGAGALDAVDTPVLGNTSALANTAPLLAKIDLMGRYITGMSRPATAPPLSATPTAPQLVAIGASAGGPAALAAVLARLPKHFPAAVVIIQHVDTQFAAALADWLKEQSALPVRLAVEGDRPMAGSVLLAGTNDHLQFVDAHRLGYTPHPLDYVYRPSVNVFFESVAQHWTGGAVAVLLTGMGRDGAQGLKVLRDAGTHTIAQDQATSAVYGMPKAAAQLHAAVEVLPLDQIAPALMRQCLLRV